MLNFKSCITLASEFHSRLRISLYYHLFLTLFSSYLKSRLFFFIGFYVTFFPHFQLSIWQGLSSVLVYKKWKKTTVWFKSADLGTIIKQDIYLFPVLAYVIKHIVPLFLLSILDKSLTAITPFYNALRSFFNYLSFQQQWGTNSHEISNFSCCVCSIL